MVTGLQHLVTCRCVLPQYKRAEHPPRHQFVVFSVIDDDVVRPKFVQCNNCGVIHRVTDICRSEIKHGKEDMRSIVSIDDIKASMPPGLANILESSGVDLPTWENAQFVLQEKAWGQFVVLSTDVDGSARQVKYVQVLGDNWFKVETYEREEEVRR
jgi:hypothetical protein